MPTIPRPPQGEAVPDDACVIEGGALPLVPEGEYQLRFDYWETAIMFGRAPKLILKFTIITMGEYFDCVQLNRYHNVRRLIGKPQKYGRFQVGPRSDFVREYGNLFASTLKRLDRAPMSEFGKHIIVGRARTVKFGSNQKGLTALAQYSVISELMKTES